MSEECVDSNITCKSFHDHLSIESTRLALESAGQRTPAFLVQKTLSNTWQTQNTGLSKRWDSRRDGYLRNGLLPVCKGA